MSYAAAMSPHVCGTNAEAYMSAYCREHNRAAGNPEDAEELVGKHFESDGAAKQRNGYQQLMALHKEGQDPVFKAAANATTVTALEAQDAFREMQAKLRAQPELTAVVCLLPDGAPAHSVAMTFDPATNKFLVSDPNKDLVEECDVPDHVDPRTRQPIKTGTILILEPKPEPRGRDRKNT